MGTPNMVETLDDRIPDQRIIIVGVKSNVEVAPDQVLSIT